MSFKNIGEISNCGCFHTNALPFLEGFIDFSEILVIPTDLFSKFEINPLTDLT